MVTSIGRTSYENARWAGPRTTERARRPIRTLRTLTPMLRELVTTTRPPYASTALVVEDDTVTTSPRGALNIMGAKKVVAARWQQEGEEMIRFGYVAIGIALLGSVMAPPRTGRASTAPVLVAAVDPCRVRLPLNDGMSGLRYSTLHAAPYTLTLGQYGYAGTHQELRFLHGTSLPGDTIEQIAFALPGRIYLVSGLVHAFTGVGGLTQRVCADQPLYINHGNSAYDIAHPHTVMVRVDGLVASAPPDAAGYVTMKFARFTIWIGSARYALFGPME